MANCEGNEEFRNGRRPDNVGEEIMKQDWQKWLAGGSATGSLPPGPALLLLLGTALLLYARSFSGGWTMDDFPVIVSNPDIRSLAGFFSDSRPGRPLREITYLLDYQLFGLDPAGYRIQNIFWHGLNAWLLWWLALRLRLGLLAAWGAALIFVTHPVMVEVVANSSHRKDSLALAFALLSVLAYIRFCTENRHRWLSLAGAAGAWLLALGAKQNALMVPLVWLAYEGACLPAGQRFLLRWPRILVGAGITGFVGGVAWFVLAGGQQRLAEAIRGPLTKMNQAADWTLNGYYQAVLKAWAFMVGKAVWPFELGVEYTFSLPKSWFDPWVLAGIALAAGVAVLIMVTRRHSPPAFVAIAWLAAFWLPTANLWPLAYLAADRYLYAPLAGGCLLAGLLLGRLPARVGTMPALLLLGVLTASGAWLTWRQVPSWHNEEALWLQAYLVSPASAFALNNLGNIALERGDRPTALRFYKESFRNNPYNPTSNYNLGFLYRTAGDLPAAQKHLRNFLIVADPREYARERLAVEEALRSLSASGR